jgi:hypothetical protein
MHKMKLMIITAVAIFMAGALTSATAQKEGSLPLPLPIGPLNGTYTMAMTANQLSAGDTEYAMAETYGWTCYGKTSGDLTGFMFVSLNYALPEYLSTDKVEAGSTPVEIILPTSNVTGGSWSKLIFMRGQYVGSVYGKVVGGTLVWSQMDLSATMSLQLTADDGTGYFVGNAGKGTFEGTLDPSQKSGNLTGVLTLNY